MELRTKNKKQAQAWEILFNNNGIFELLYGGAKGGAKSYTGCNWEIEMCGTYPGVNYFVARKELNDLRKYTLPSFIEVFEKNNLKFDDFCKFNGQDSIINFYNGSKIHMIACKHLPSDPMFERFGSIQMTGGWLEEAGEISIEARNNLRASIGRWKNIDYQIPRKLLYTANPKKNFLKSEFVNPFKQHNLTVDKAYIQAFVYDNMPYIGKDYIKNLENLTGITRQRLLKGDWDYEDDPTNLINYESILNLYTNDHIIGNKKYIITDAARFGSDRAIVTVWNGLILIEYHLFNISSTVEIQNCINAMRSKYQIQASNCLVDEDGVGGGIVDNCKIQGFVNNSKAYNKIYQNLKTECGYKLSELINNIYLQCDLPDNEKESINEELQQLKTFDSDKDGKLKILPKEKIKENIGRSPDWLDIFIMRMFYELDKNQNKLINDLDIEKIFKNDS